MKTGFSWGGSMRRMGRLVKEQGFTLIELVIVIVLLGILVATALPKFADLTAHARIAANRSFSAAFAAAIGRAHGIWLAEGSPGTVTLEGGIVMHMNSSGWPDGMGTSTEASDQGCANIWNNILQNPTQAIPGVVGCGSTTSCYNAIYAAGPAETCTYRVNNFSEIRVVYILSGVGAGDVNPFDR